MLCDFLHYAIPQVYIFKFEYSDMSLSVYLRIGFLVRLSRIVIDTLFYLCNLKIEENLSKTKVKST